MRRERLRALKGAWRARHGQAIHFDPEISTEYQRRFYGSLHGDARPAWHLLRHLETLAG